MRDIIKYYKMQRQKLFLHEAQDDRMTNGITCIKCFEHPKIVKKALNRFFAKSSGVAGTIFNVHLQLINFDCFWSKLHQSRADMLQSYSIQKYSCHIVTDDLKFFRNFFHRIPLIILIILFI